MHIPIKLADDTIVYSAGVGTVVFNPVVYGKESQSVEFTRTIYYLVYISQSAKVSSCMLMNQLCTSNVLDRLYLLLQ